MHLKSLVAAAGFAGAMVVGAASIGTPVQAQNAREAELIGFHQLCEKGDRTPASDSSCSSARIASGLRNGASIMPIGCGGRDADRIEPATRPPRVGGLVSAMRKDLMFVERLEAAPEARASSC